MIESRHSCLINWLQDCGSFEDVFLSGSKNKIWWVEKDVILIFFTSNGFWLAIEPKFVL